MAAPVDNEKMWEKVDGYINDLLAPADPMLEHVLKASSEAGLPEIQVSAAQGKMLMLLAKLRGAKRILEIGTLGGYSTIWLARGLTPGGRIVTLEYDAKHAEVARANMARAGLSDVVDVRTGKAIETLPVIAAARGGGSGPFDMVFIDADKASTPEYFQWALRLTRVGSLIIVDNVVREGEIIDAASEDPSVRGMRRFLDMLAAEKRVSATAIQTVGSKGYDGFAMVVVTESASR